MRADAPGTSTKVTMGMLKASTKRTKRAAYVYVYAVDERSSAYSGWHTKTTPHKFTRISYVRTHLD